MLCSILFNETNCPLINDYGRALNVINNVCHGYSAHAFIHSGKKPYRQISNILYKRTLNYTNTEDIFCGSTLKRITRGIWNDWQWNTIPADLFISVAVNRQHRTTVFHVPFLLSALETQTFRRYIFWVSVYFDSVPVEFTAIANTAKPVSSILTNHQKCLRYRREKRQSRNVQWLLNNWVFGVFEYAFRYLCTKGNGFRLNISTR